MALTFSVAKHNEWTRIATCLSATARVRQRGTLIQRFGDQERSGLGCNDTLEDSMSFLRADKAILIFENSLHALRLNGRGLLTNAFFLRVLSRHFPSL